MASSEQTTDEFQAAKHDDYGKATRPRYEGDVDPY
jgi:hypothetical protein